MLDRGQAPYTLEEHVNSLVSRMERVERRPAQEVPEGGGALVFVQSSEPPAVPVGTLWFDTDETCS